MKKIRLDLDGLRVESFAVAGDRPTPAGTVRGHAPATSQTTGPSREFSWCGTCDPYTCYPTACGGQGECTLEYYCTVPTMGLCSCVD